MKHICQTKDYSFKNILSFLFISPFFFPALIQGPIENPKKIIDQLKQNSSLSFDNINLGFSIIFLGLLKYYFIYNRVFEITKYLFNLNNLSGIISGSMMATISAYLLMSSYCDIGRGVAKIFDIHIMMNFRPIIFSKSPADFWKRWNIGLGIFLKENVTFPLMLNYGKKIPHKYFVLITFIFFGLWHDISFAWFIFGLVNGLIIIFYSSSLFQNFITFKSRQIQACINFLLVLFIIFINGFLTNYELTYSIFNHSNLLLNQWHLIAILLWPCLDFLQRDYEYDFLCKLRPHTLLTLNIFSILLIIYSFVELDVFKISPIPPAYFKF